LLGLFLFAADEPFTAKPEKHRQRAQPLILVELYVNLAL
jgi:hypothetical protein